MDIVPGWKTAIGALGLLATGIALLLDGKTAEGIAALAAAVTAFGIGKKIDRAVKKSTGAAVLALVGCALAGCAAPRSDQGQGQGGSVTGGIPTIAIYIGTGGGIETTIATSPAAAPAATSAAQASQRAEVTTDVRPAVGDDAVKALTPGGTLVPKTPPTPPEPPR